MVLGVFLLIHPEDHLLGQIPMLAEWAWLAISVLVYPKDVQWGIGKGSVQTSQVLANQTHSNMPLWT